MPKITDTERADQKLDINRLRVEYASYRRKMVAQGAADNTVDFRTWMKTQYPKKYEAKYTS